MIPKEFSSSQDCENKVLTNSECLAVFMILTGQNKFPLPSPLSDSRKTRVSRMNRINGYGIVVRDQRRDYDEDEDEEDDDGEDD